MKPVERDESLRRLIKNESLISIPLGLLGFEAIKRYALHFTTEEQPFMWLQMFDDANQGFVVVSAAAVAPNYAPEFSQQDLQFLDVKSSDDAIVLNIVTFRAGEATVNLKGPIVLNRTTLVAKQCIPVNAASFPLYQSVSGLAVAA